jgi:asparagine synthase (glutamine-hydrolysing)
MSQKITSMFLNRRNRALKEPFTTPHGAGSHGICWRGNDHEVVLNCNFKHLYCHPLGDVAIGLQGYIAGEVRPRERLENVCSTYLDTGEVKVEHLDGSFTLVLADGRMQRLCIYRNLFGTTPTYYRSGEDGFVASDNLATLIDLLGQECDLESSFLPTYFLHRFAPGRDTLFRGVHRLLPGEMITVERGRFRRAQRRVVADLYAEPGDVSDSADAVEEIMARVLTEHLQRGGRVANLFSGGVDSTYLQALAGRVPGADDVVPYTIDVPHPHTEPHTACALDAARALGVTTTLHTVRRPYIEMLQETIAAMAEPPNHVQTVYFGDCAAALAAGGIKTALCGQAADSLFGIPLAARLQCATLLKRVLPSPTLLAWVAWLARMTRRENLIDVCRIARGRVPTREQPLHRVGVFTDWSAIDECFGPRAIDDALQARQEMLDLQGIRKDPLTRLHFSGLFGEALDTASLWTALFARAGVELVCPFLDSRMVRAVVNISAHKLYRFRKPKELLNQTLRKYAPTYNLKQPKLGFGQPIFEWLGRDGPLRPWVEQIDRYDFVDARVLQRCKDRPTWFLYSLLCFHLWHKRFVKKQSSRRAG